MGELFTFKSSPKWSDQCLIGSQSQVNLRPRSNDRKDVERRYEAILVETFPSTSLSFQASPSLTFPQIKDIKGVHEKDSTPLTNSKSSSQTYGLNPVQNSKTSCRLQRNSQQPTAYSFRHQSCFSPLSARLPYANLGGCSCTAASYCTTPHTTWRSALRGPRSTWCPCPG